MVFGLGMVEVVFFAVLALYVLVGFILFQVIDIPEDFYVMDRQAGGILIAGTLFASFMSASTMMGIAGIVYTEGAVMWLAIYGSWPGLVVGMLYVGRRLRMLEDVTVPDFIGDRYQSESVRVTATLIMMVGLVGYGVIQLIGAGYLLSGVLNVVGYQQIVLLFGAALLVFTVAGGMYSVVVTDTLMAVAMVITGLVLAPIAIGQAGGLEALTTTLPAENPGVLTVGGANMDMPLGWLVGQWMLWFAFFMVAPWIISRAFPANNDFDLMTGTNIATLLSTVVVTVLFLGVSATYLLNSSIEPVDLVVIWMSRELVGPITGGLAIAGIMAGILSTTSTIFIYAGFGLSRDLFERAGGRVLSESQRLLAARIAQIAVVAVVTLIALFEPLGIYWLGAWAGALFAVAWAPMIIAGLEWEGANKYGALASMIGGFGSYVLLYQLSQVWGTITIPFMLDPVIPALAISSALMIGVSLVTETTSEEVEFFRDVSDRAVSEATVEQLSQSELRKKYNRAKYFAIGILVVGVVIYAYLFLTVFLPLL
ncbi:sodium:solute symporter family protein [Natrinema amylolyticum]|uniref:sodium:solute symporter family protein n=1 Tax=Natrinema amylolyticum TaxID=2878679 RepID=UPI001CFA5F1A|nr:sodium:solute symporter family protein [Natrinema amylolyticum]